ncbi:CehA/McbA family metallohydrolase [Phytohabitans kaempferiae]|uniref:CehA/McbA family metallohydrolase n=1 Tax=Phytohabitans kaempferiae TaxID=1620943 RepID=A0ABV6M2X2_9ACTN
MDFVVSALRDPQAPEVVVWDSGCAKLGPLRPFVIPGGLLDLIVFSRPDRHASFSDSVHRVSYEQPCVVIGGHTVEAAEPSAAGTLELSSAYVSRWTVLDERGGAWFPDDQPHRYDAQGVPYFYGRATTVRVPSGPTRVRVARGTEFKAVEQLVDIAPDRTIELFVEPERIHNGLARGWASADLHVHLNYSGDHVNDIARGRVVRQGEGLHVMNLLAANWNTDLIYDDILLTETLQANHADDDGTVVGVEYRNNLYGHMTVLNPDARPERFHTGHPRATHDVDWPPNSQAAGAFREGGAFVTYTHPFLVDVAAAGGLDEVFSRARARSCEARALVVDAPLGLVDGVDVVGGPNHIIGSMEVVRRLYNCGLRFALTAGTDVLLSFSSAWGELSNPPGWFRAYAEIGTEQPTSRRWQQAASAGRTFVTNGPWLELTVNDVGIGGCVEAGPGARLQAKAEVSGAGLEELLIVGPDGPLARSEIVSDDGASLSVELAVESPTWLAATAHGGKRATLYGDQPSVFAHTSPVWVRVDGREIARADDAQWCLDWIARFQELVRADGRFSAEAQWDDFEADCSRATRFYAAIAGRTT